MSEADSPRGKALLRLSSRDNAWVQRLRKMAHEPLAYRKLGQCWLEGEHLCAAYAAHGGSAAVAVVDEAWWSGEHGLAQPEQPQAQLTQALAAHAQRVVVLPSQLWRHVSALESPSGVGFVVTQPCGGAADDIQPQLATVVLDRLQDAGNVGSIIRSAAAMGFAQIVALRGSAGLASPKVLRSAMGAHFGLRLVEQVEPEDLAKLQVPLVATSSHTPHSLTEVPLPWPLAWVLGHEGQGVSADVMAACALLVRIPQPGGQESLNVAAAAAICMYETMRQHAAPQQSFVAHDDRGGRPVGAANLHDLP